jgi:hypothetical protein
MLSSFAESISAKYRFRQLSSLLVTTEDKGARDVSTVPLESTDEEDGGFV